MFKRKSVLYTWCLSYGLLLLMMVVMCIMLGRNARNQLISEYKSITQTLQKQSNNAINDYFDELERCAYEISNDYLVNDFVSTPDPSGSKYYNLQPIQQSLSVYALQSGGEVSRYLYMDNIGRALSSDAIFRLHEFYASLGLEAAMSAGDFTTLLQDYHYNELYVFETGGKSEALMLTSVPLVGGTPKGTLVQVMNPETIAGMIQSNSAVEDSTTVLLDSDGSFLLDTARTAPESRVASYHGRTDVFHRCKVRLDHPPGTPGHAGYGLHDSGAVSVFFVYPIQAAQPASQGTCRHSGPRAERK